MPLNRICHLATNMSCTGRKMNKGFNYSQDAPGIAYYCSANPPSEPLCSTKRQLFRGKPGAGGCGVRRCAAAPCEDACLCWQGFVWEPCPLNDSPAWASASAFVSSVSLLNYPISVTSEGGYFPRWWMLQSVRPGGTGLNARHDLQVTSCCFTATANVRQLQLCSAPQTHGTTPTDTINSFAAISTAVPGFSLFIIIFEIYFPPRHSYCKALEVCATQMIMLSSNLGQRESL